MRRICHLVSQRDGSFMGGKNVEGSCAVMARQIEIDPEIGLRETGGRQCFTIS
eukprot:SAG31_NODE_2621_length_5362_cov_5.185256_3_plen_53_part_00